MWQAESVLYRKRKTDEIDWQGQQPIRMQNTICCKIKKNTQKFHYNCIRLTSTSSITVLTYLANNTSHSFETVGKRSPLHFRISLTESILSAKDKNPT